MGQVYDLGDPSEPQFIRNFGLPGQQPGSNGPVPSEMHGVISTGPKGNRIYAGYGTTKDGIIEILDRDKLIHGPKEPTEANLESPMIAPARSAARRRRAHDLSLDRSGRSRTREIWPGHQQADFLVIVGETTDNECHALEQMMHIFDITDGNENLRNLNLLRARGERQFLQPRRPFRHALDERKHDADLLQAHHVRRLLQRRRARR